MTFETFDQSDEKTWHDQKKLTKTKTFWEHLLRAILETWDLWDICSEWWEDMTWPKKIDKDKDILRTPAKSNPRDLWHLRHWLQFWQLRTWIHDNLCVLTINCDTGQHLQFLRCFACNNVEHISDLVYHLIKLLQQFDWRSNLFADGVLSPKPWCACII